MQNEHALRNSTDREYVIGIMAERSFEWPARLSAKSWLIHSHFLHSDHTISSSTVLTSNSRVVAVAFCSRSSRACDYDDADGDDAVMMHVDQHTSP